ncbi:MAG: HNH endonuclease, partial [Micrococcales bacterium]|nr:HNH endonuclease [Micrococcales bacterium]
TRTRQERDADALVALAQYSVDTPPERLSAERPHIALVVSEDTWAGLRQQHTDDDATTSPGAGSTAAVVAALDGHEPVRDIDGIVWPASELAALACDCEITRMVIDARSQVLDAGHEVRLFHGHQRRVITTRDGGCAWPGCTMPVRYTELHHMDWWVRNGTTSVERGIALCSWHHHRVHDLDLAIERLPRPGRGLAGQATAAYRFLRRDGTVFCDEQPHPPGPGDTPAFADRDRAANPNHRPDVGDPGRASPAPPSEALF